MPVLYMQTDTVRDLGQQIHRFTANSDDENGRLSSSLQNLASSWQGGSSEHFQGEMQSVLSQMRSLSNEAETLRTRLLREVDEWERVDHRFGAGSMLGITFPDLGWQLPRIDIPKLLPIVGLLPFVPLMPLPLLLSAPGWLTGLLPHLPWTDQTDRTPPPNPPPVRTGDEDTVPSPASNQQQHSGQPAQEQPETVQRPTPVPLEPGVEPLPGEQCARYARRRRLSLGQVDHAYQYIEEFKDVAFELDPGVSDLRNHIAEGYALVWEPGESLPLPRGASGHVAIVEEVGPNYVVVSEANWNPPRPDGKIYFDELLKLHIIP